MLNRQNDFPARKFSARRSSVAERRIFPDLATMPREAELSLNERAFILQALQENIRLDDRALDACRPLKITFGEDYGTADIQLGKTRYNLIPHLLPNPKLANKWLEIRLYSFRLY